MTPFLANPSLFPQRILSGLLLLLAVGFLAVDGSHAQGRKIETELSVDDKQCLEEEARLVISVLQSTHLNKQSFYGIDSEELILTFLSYLDPECMIFNEQQVKFILKRFGNNLKPAYLSKGDVYPAFEIFNSFVDKARNRTEWIQQRLDQPFNLGSNDAITFNRDASILEWPKNKGAANQKWEDYLKFQIINEILAGQDQDTAILSVREKYNHFLDLIENFDPITVRELFLNALTKLYDPHSSYMSWESMQSFRIEMEGTLVGIGVEVAMSDGECVIEDVIPGGPADLSNQVFEGDKIISIREPGAEPFVVFGQRLRNVVKQLRGEPESSITLEIEAAHSASKSSIELIRQEIDMSASRCWARIYTIPSNEQNRRIGVITIPQFYGDGLGEESDFSVSADVRSLIGKLDAMGMEALALDIRGNPGGLMEEAVSLTGLFIEQGPVVIVEDGSGEAMVSNDTDKGVAFRGPLAVLTSRKSASASEILAGTLAAYHRAIIIGDKTTFGKGTMQSMRDFAELRSERFGNTSMGWGGLSNTTAMFFTAGGHSTQKQGVESDIMIRFAQNPDIVYETDLAHALNWKQIESALPEDVENECLQGVSVLHENTLQHLKDRSTERRGEIEEFYWWNRLQDYQDEIYERTDFSLNLDQRQEEYQQTAEKRRLLRKEGSRLGENLRFEQEAVFLDAEKQIFDQRQETWKQSQLPDGNFRTNRFYNNTFYWFDPSRDEIVPIRVRGIDYEKLIPDVSEIYAAMTLAKKSMLNEDQMTFLLASLEKERGENFDSRKILETVTDEPLDNVAGNNFFSDFFLAVISTHQELGGNITEPDVPLRECLRVLDDWLSFPKTTDSNHVEIP